MIKTRGTKDYDKLSDEDLLRRYQDADPKAFETFYRRHRQLVFGFLRSRLNRSADAEEAFQETFLRVHKYILTFDPSQSPLGWVMTIARNTAVDIIKKNATQSAAKAAIVDVVQDKSESTEAQVIARQEIETLLDALSPQDRLLIEERFLREESYEQLAARANMQETGVRQRVSRLIRRLRKQRS